MAVPRENEAFIPLRPHLTQTCPFVNRKGPCRPAGGKRFRDGDLEDGGKITYRMCSSSWQ
jgi:hypothetical protein